MLKDFSFRPGKGRYAAFALAAALAVLPMGGWASGTRQPNIATEPQQATYDGQPKLYTPRFNGGDLAAEDIQVFYRPAEEGIFRPEQPVDAGEYLVQLVYPGDDNHRPAEAESRLTIDKTLAIADPTTITETQRESVSFQTEGDQRYMVLPSDYAPPATDAGLWVDGTGHPFEWDGLSVGTNYIIYTYTPATRNTTTSRLHLTHFNTEHEFSCGVKAISYDAAYPVDNIYQQDQPVQVEVTNTGTGKLRDVMVYISGDTSMMQLEMDSFSGMLASGQSESFTIRPAEDAPEGIYRANIMVKAIGNEPGSGDTFESEAIDVKFRVDNSYTSIPEEGVVDLGNIDWQQDETGQPATYDNQQAQPTVGETLQQPAPVYDTANTDSPVLEPLVISHSAANQSNTTAQGAGLLASLNTVIDSYGQTPADDPHAQPDYVPYTAPEQQDETIIIAGNNQPDEQSKAEPVQPKQEEIDFVQAAEVEREDMAKRSGTMRASSLIWFYAIVILAALIFGGAIFWADSILRRRNARHQHRRRKRKVAYANGQYINK